MKNYNTPEIEVVALFNEDVITASVGRGEEIETDRVTDW